MWILSLDTSADTSFIALADTQRPSTEWLHLEGQSGESHNEELACLSSKLLKDAKILPNSLGAIIVGEGPGSFTGLRIGFAFAKGLAAGAGAPCIALGSFAACAHEFLQGGHGSVAVVSDARRAEVFFAEFTMADGAPVDRTSPCIIPTGEVMSRAPDALIVVHGTAEPGWPFKDAPRPKNLGRSLVELAIAKGIDKERLSTPSLAALKPNYLRAVSAKTIEERRKEGIMR